MKKFLFAIFVSLTCFGMASAQKPLGDYQATVEERREALDAIEASLAADGAKDLIELRRRVRELRAAGQADAAPFVQVRDGLKSELEALGPKPAEDQPAEAETIASERGRLTEELGVYEAAVRQADLNLVQANRLLEEIASARRSSFYDNVFMQGQSPLNPDLMATGVSGAKSGVEKAATWADEAVNRRDQRGSLNRDILMGGIAVLLALILFLPVRSRLNRALSDRMRANEPTPSRRAIAAAARTASRVVPGLLGGAIIYETLKWLGIFGADTYSLAQAIWIGFLMILAVDGAATAMFSPNFPGWRVIPLKSSRARVVRTLLLVATVILSLDAIFRIGASMLGTPQETAILQSAGVALLLSLLLIALSRTRLWVLEVSRAEEVDSGAQRTFRNLSTVALALSLLAILGTALGYVAFGYFVMTRVFFLVGLAAGAWFVRGLVREGMSALGATPEPLAQSDEEGVETATKGSLILFWFGVVLDLAIIAVFVIPGFLVLGADWADVRDTAIDAFFGFTIGSVTISIADLLAAILVFVVILSATRFLQRTAEKRLFPHMRVNPGIQNSFRTLIGYVGILVATLSAVGAIGLDLSSLAIVAGALSVGIGFGLQSIVSNFVSGLILLFERPIKVGDWIVVPSGEGYVRRISVRSTEIETFDRSSVIVPNSELITGTVTNLTHGDKIGRIIVPVGVSYNEDPERIVEILQEITNEHPKVLKTPEHFVYFFGFGDSSLDFEIRAFLRDVSLGLRVRNDLRIAIFKRFREEGIEIPFPQRVVHVQTAASATEKPADTAPASLEHSQTAIG